jgi:hypothetical protein
MNYNEWLQFAYRMNHNELYQHLQIAVLLCQAWDPQCDVAQLAIRLPVMSTNPKMRVRKSGHRSLMDVLLKCFGALLGGRVRGTQGGHESGSGSLLFP